MLQVPSVTMNGGSLILVTRKPLTKPQAVPTASPIGNAISTGTPSSTASRPMMTDDSTMIAPTERSTPAVRMTSVCAEPTIAMIVTCCRISDRLNG